MRYSILNRYQIFKHNGYDFTDTNAAVLIYRDSVYCIVRLLE